MMQRTSRVRLAAGLIVIVLAACDNVEWGGADVVVVPPEPQATEQSEDAEAERTDRLPDGPVLYHVQVADGRASMVPVGEITGDSLVAIGPGTDPAEFGRRFIGQRFRRGTEFALFDGTDRVATLAVESTALPEAGSCPALPRATGTPELVPGADTIPEFLALSKAYAPDIPRGRDASLTASRGMQVVAPILAERLLRARGAPLPSSWQNAMVQLRPFRIDDGADAAPGFAATFLTGDTLGPGLDDQGQALFMIAEPRPDGSGYDTTYTDHRVYERGGKAAPRVVDFLDWNRDGTVEALLEVYGTGGRWYEAVGRVDGEWRRTFLGRCEPPAAPAQAEDATSEAATPAEGAAADAATPAADATADAADAAGPATAERPAEAAVRPTAPASSAVAPASAEPFPEPQIELSVPAGDAGDRTS